MRPSVILNDLELNSTCRKSDLSLLKLVGTVLKLRHVVSSICRIPSGTEQVSATTCYGISMLYLRALGLFDHYVVDLDDVTSVSETEVKSHNTVTTGDTSSGLVEYVLNTSLKSYVAYVNHLSAVLVVVLVLNGYVADRVVGFELESYTVALAFLSNRSMILNLSTPLTVLIYIDVDRSLLVLTIPLQVGFGLGIPAIVRSEPSLPRISVSVTLYIDAASMPAFATLIVRTEVDIFLTYVSEVNYIVATLSRIPSSDLVVSNRNYLELIALCERVVENILSLIVRINSEQVVNGQVMNIPAVDVTNEVVTVNEVNSLLLGRVEVNVVKPEGQVRRIVNLDLVNIAPVGNACKLRESDVNSVPLLSLYIYRNTNFGTTVDRHYAEGDVICSPNVKVESFHFGAIHAGKLKTEVAQTGGYILLTELFLGQLRTGTPLAEVAVSIVGSRVNSVYLICSIGRSSRSSVRSIEKNRSLTTCTLNLQKGNEHTGITITAEEERILISLQN